MQNYFRTSSSAVGLAYLPAGAGPRIFLRKTPLVILNNGMRDQVRIRHIPAYVRAWARHYRMPREIVPDLIQEGWVAALTHGHDRGAVWRALSNYAYAGYRFPLPESRLGRNASGEPIGFDDLPDSMRDKRRERMA